MIEQGLGEDLSAKQVYDEGQLPALLPQAIQVGEPGCLLNGEDPILAVEAETLDNGFVPACFVAPVIPDDPWTTFSAFQSCSIQLAYAKIIEWLYLGETARITDLLSGILPASYTLTYIAETGSFPQMVIAVSPQATLVWTAGTGNFQQLALQATYALIPPTNQGIFSTLPAWYLASDYVRANVSAAGANPTGPIFLCGHSYGAALSVILAARYRAANPNREIRFLTYGMPKLGDARLRDLIREQQGLNLANTFDLVPRVPCDILTVWQLFTLIGADILFVWPGWVSMPMTSSMDTNGVLTVDANPELDFDTAVVVATKVLAGIDLLTILEHEIGEYFKRILARCPNPEWPLTAADYVKMLAP